METAKPQQSVLKTDSSGSPNWKAPSLRLSGLQGKLIFPYVILTLILASIGIFVITRLVAASEQERFRYQLYQSAGTAADGIVRQERLQIDRMRLVIFTEGMTSAMVEKDAAQISDVMRSYMANASIDMMTALDTEGKEIVTLGRDPASGSYRIQENVDFSSLKIVQMVLNGVKDEQGDKFTELVALKDQGPVLFTSAPVLDANGKLYGVMLSGVYLKTLLADLKEQAAAEVLLVDSAGNVIGSTLSAEVEGFLDLVENAKALTPETLTVPYEVEVDRRPAQAAYSPLVIRSQEVGWIGVVRYSQYLVTATETSRNLFIVLFTIGTLAVIVIGYLLARNIARPILRLREMSQSVAAGDLNQSTGLQRADEIGDLAEAFDTMTSHLRDRTEEAARLYNETLQRNRELAEINAKLEAAQMQLVQSEKLAAIGQLTAGIVHDVKNPFAVIMGMAEVLGEDDQLDPELQHGLKVIRESAVKGNNIVSDLLKFARQSAPEKHTGDLRETLQASIRLTAYLTRRYSLETSLPESPVIATYDAQQIEQVLINMIHNAVQAMPNGGSLKIALEPLEGAARFTVEDTGCGIAPDLIKRIFDPFFTTKPEGEGTGLGLSVSYGIIANHHGRIEVESEPGRGTKFVIYLPTELPSSTAGGTEA